MTPIKDLEAAAEAARSQWMAEVQAGTVGRYNRNAASYVAFQHALDAWQTALREQNAEQEAEEARCRAARRARNEAIEAARDMAAAACKAAYGSAQDIGPIAVAIVDGEEPSLAASRIVAAREAAERLRPNEPHTKWGPNDWRG